VTGARRAALPARSRRAARFVAAVYRAHRSHGQAGARRNLLSAALPESALRAARRGCRRAL